MLTKIPGSLSHGHGIMVARRMNELSLAAMTKRDQLLRCISAEEERSRSLRQMMEARRVQKPAPAAIETLPPLSPRMPRRKRASQARIQCLDDELPARLAAARRAKAEQLASTSAAARRSA